MAKKQTQGKDQGSHTPRYHVVLTVRRRQLAEPSDLTAYGFVEALMAEEVLPDDLSDISIEIRQVVEPSANKHRTDVEIYER